jgi:hypothetical protein
MLAILYALGTFVADLCKSRSQLEAENVFLRHQLNLTLAVSVMSFPRFLFVSNDRIGTLSLRFRRSAAKLLSRRH